MDGEVRFSEGSNNVNKGGGRRQDFAAVGVEERDI